MGSWCFAMFPSCLCCTIWAKYAKTRLVCTDLKQRERRKNSLLFVYVVVKTEPENWSFYVVVLTSTAEKCTKMRAARVARSFFLF